MAAKIDNIIDGLNIFKVHNSNPVIKLSGYMMRLPEFDDDDFTAEEIVSLNEIGWVLSPIKTVDGPVAGYEGYIFSGDV